MSLAAQGRGMFVLPYWWEVWESWGAEPWVVQVLKEEYSLPFLSRPPLSSTPVPLPSYSPSSVRGLALCGGSRLTVQRCYRISVLGAWLLQPFICNTEGHWWLEASHRSFSPQPLRPTVSLSYGDGSVSPPIPSPGGLDGLPRPSGRLPLGPCPSGLAEVPPILC